MRSWSTVVDCEERAVSMMSAPEVTVTVSLPPMTRLSGRSACCPVVRTTLRSTRVLKPGAAAVTV